MTTSQFASKIAAAKSSSTKSKYHMQAMDTLTKAEYINCVNMVSELEMSNNTRNSNAQHTDSMFS